jgi:transposase-like protein
VRRRARGRSLLVCPQCGSPRIALIAGSIVGQVYRCPRCNYQGSLVLETEVPDEASGTSRS